MTESRERALPADALERVDAFLQPRRGLGAVRQLPLNRLVADCSDKYIALDKGGAPAAFIAVAPASHPGSVRDGAMRTLAIRRALGDTLGQSVLAPAFVGDIDGCSYSITEYCEPVSHGRWLGRWQRTLLKPKILGWLGDVTRHTSRPAQSGDQGALLSIEALAKHPAVAEEVRQAARTALEELAGGLWQPRQVVAHNDLWWGNFIRQRSHAKEAPAFYVIDWAGGRVDGTPIYDLVRVAMSLRLSKREFRKALLGQCATLECEITQAAHYLCAAFGALSLGLGEWPVAQFALTANSCLLYAASALP